MDPRRPAFRTTISVAVILVVATACAQAPTQRRTDAPACPRVAAPEGLRAPLLPRTTCLLPQFDPARFRELLGQLRGVPVVVNIWGSWCGPCLREAPDLARVAREFEGRVQFLGVDINDLRVPAANFIRRFGWPYPSVFDPPGVIRDSLGLVGQPHTLVFDAAGRRTLVHPGATTARQLRTELRKLLRRPAAGRP
ncbi:MAG TPA: TlpA disulfide reductase family protein [Actinomycetota bacterium]|nr:TlpA disulfide reductase family protein [Actinomycetota bacterium]